jgi:diadenosine tetraphosphatase ApaH/serine/threonine PP2A family protein phosphatase
MKSALLQNFSSLRLSEDPKLAEEQMTALIFYLVTFGHLDGSFDESERDFLRAQVRSLVEQRYASAGPMGADLINRQTAHYFEIVEQLEAQIKELLDEVVADGEDVEAFVINKLKLRCYEIFRHFDADNRRALLAAVDAFLHADGVAHPAELRFRNELAELLQAELVLSADEIEIVEEGPSAAQLLIREPAAPTPRQDNHPFFASAEEHYSRDPERRRQQAIADYRLLEQVSETLAAQRAAGAGKLKGKQLVSEFYGQASFLDGHVYVHPLQPGRNYELLVFGDLHGCYSCLKAGLLQTDFFNKVKAFRENPNENPDVKVIFLGDYIDRGKFSYNGVLRAALRLFMAVPEHVFLLRGNHEYYIEHEGKIYGGVRPAEAINTLSPYMPQKMFEAYMRFFEELPNLLFFDKLLFVHGGIPRDELLRERYRDLSSLNDPDLRFQMLWSDPSSAEFVPPELQRQNARFGFGRKQLQAFLRKLGAEVVVRGHEKINEGFRAVFDDPGARLFTLFSAGGEDNGDLPLASSYRSVTPRALSISVRDGEATLTPITLDYVRYNDPAYNAFFQSPPEIFHKAE